MLERYFRYFEDISLVFWIDYNILYVSLNFAYSSNLPSIFVLFRVECIPLWWILGLADTELPWGQVGGGAGVRPNIKSLEVKWVISDAYLDY